MQGLSGAFFRPLAISYGLAVLASMAVALTVTPALALLLLARMPAERRASPLIRGLQAAYRSLLTRTVGRPRAAYAVVATTMLAGLVVSPFLRGNFADVLVTHGYKSNLLGRAGLGTPGWFASPLNVTVACCP